jgi:hypothetical protein
MGNHSALLQFTKTHRFRLLVCALVAEMVVSPVADYHPYIGALLAVSVGLVVLAAACFMANRKIIKLVVLPIAAVGLVARLVEAFAGRQHADARWAP